MIFDQAAEKLYSNLLQNYTLCPLPLPKLHAKVSRLLQTKRNGATSVVTGTVTWFALVSPQTIRTSDLSRPSPTSTPSKCDLKQYCRPNATYTRSSSSNNSLVWQGGAFYNMYKFVEHSVHRVQGEKDNAHNCKHCICLGV